MIIQMIYYNQIELPDNSIGGREIKQKKNTYKLSYSLLLFDIVFYKSQIPDIYYLI